MFHIFETAVIGSTGIPGFYFFTLQYITIASIHLKLSFLLTKSYPYRSGIAFVLIFLVTPLPIKMIMSTKNCNALKVERLIIGHRWHNLCIK